MLQYLSEFDPLLRMNNILLSVYIVSPPYPGMPNLWIWRADCTTSFYIRDLSIHGSWYLLGVLESTRLYHILFICSSVDGHLGCFYLLVIVNNAVMNIGVQVFV